MLESDRLFRSLSYTSYSGIRLIPESIVSRVRCVCHTPDAKVCLFVQRVGTFSYTPRTGISRRSSGEEFLLHAPCWNMSGRSSGEDYLLYAPGWNVSGRSSVEDYPLYAPGWTVSGRSSGEDYLLYAP